MMEEIGKKEIRGINLRQLITATMIIGSIVYTSTKSLNALHDIQVDDTYKQVQIDVLKIDIKNIQTHQSQQDIEIATQNQILMDLLKEKN